jgi:hypothetical protein
LVKKAYFCSKIKKMIMTNVYDEIVELITSAPQPEQIVHFKPSPSAQKRLEDLLFKKREALLNEDEKHELEQYLTIEHIMRLAKARARKRLAATL